MDQNFSDILGIFKRLDEGSMKEQMWRDAERMTREQFCSKWGNEHAEFWDAIMGELDEGSMADAEKHQSGSHFGGYWKGTDKNPPKPGQGVGGGCEEGIEQECDANISPLEAKLRARWKQTKAGLQEYGMTTGGTVSPQNPGGTNNPIDAQKTAQEINQAQQNLNKLKSAGVTLPQGVSTAAKATVATTNNPAANSTGQGMDQNAKKTAMGLGQEMEKLMATGNQSQVQQVANAIKQAKLNT